MFKFEKNDILDILPDYHLQKTRALYLLSAMIGAT